MSPEYILTITALFGGLGGFVHGMTRQTPVHYTIVWPFAAVDTPARRREFGFLGDFFIGVAAAIALFFVMDSLFGLSAAKVNEPQIYLKFIALGVIGGYAGTLVLDTLSITISKRLTDQQAELDQKKAKAEQELAEFKKRLDTSIRARKLQALADAYRRWKKWEPALRTCEELISVEPSNPENYVIKSMVYADRKEAHDYEEAIKLVNEAIKKDDKCDRAYYDLACYIQLNNGSKRDVLENLGKAIDLEPMNRQWAPLDPDFAALQNDAGFKKLMGDAATPIAHEQAA